MNTRGVSKFILGHRPTRPLKTYTDQHANASSTDPPTIGYVTAGTATIYFVFLVYFDWLRSRYVLPQMRQQIWSILHLPFHLSLVLFMQGFTQFLIWSKIITQLHSAFDTADPTEYLVQNPNVTTTAVTEFLNTTTRQFLRDYPTVIDGTWATLNQSIHNISNIPDNFWPSFATLALSDNDTVPDSMKNNFDQFAYSVLVIGSTLVNSVFSTFGISLIGDITAKKTNSQIEVNSGGFQLEIENENWDRYSLVVSHHDESLQMHLILILHGVVRIRLYCHGMYDAHHDYFSHYQPHNSV